MYFNVLMDLTYLNNLNIFIASCQLKNLLHSSLSCVCDILILVPYGGIYNLG
jgi:hypothetical protein